MLVDGTPYHAIWWSEDGRSVSIIDQRHLPHRFVVAKLSTLDDVFAAIRDMHLRGAPLIGAAAACGVFLAASHTERAGTIDDAVKRAASYLATARPTAVNLGWAAGRVRDAVLVTPDPASKVGAARLAAQQIIDEELERCRLIGTHGLEILESEAERLGRPVNILTHCNAGWLACIDYGTATAPIYLGHDRGLPLHVWVDETRPRSQGARLTAWELGRHGVPHTVIADNTGGHLMQRGAVDLVIVGTDRTTRRGDVINKIGTYLKALAAADNDIPFYVALPSSSIDWSTHDAASVKIEERDADEIHYVSGQDGETVSCVRVTPESSPAANFAFDVTPAKYVTALITERGVCAASEDGLQSLFPEEAGHELPEEAPQ